jgi:peptidoglycan/LPS O-acetylase OafA/YrhL
MYLIHIPLLGLAKGAVPWLADRPVVLFPIVLAASVAVATLSERHFEAPFTRLRARFRTSADHAARRSRPSTMRHSLPGRPSSQRMW